MDVREREPRNGWSNEVETGERRYENEEREADKDQNEEGKLRAKIVKMVEKKKKIMVCAFDLQWQRNVWLWIVVGEVG